MLQRDIQYVTGLSRLNEEDPIGRPYEVVAAPSLLHCTKAYGQQTLTYHGSRQWNKFPNSLKAVNNINDFKMQLLDHDLRALQ